MLGDEEIAAPHLLDSDVPNVLRSLVLGRQLTEQQGIEAMAGFVQLGITRFVAGSLRPRMWALRHHLSAYDATYVALAEACGATALLTIDARLSRAPGLDCAVIVIGHR